MHWKNIILIVIVIPTIVLADGVNETVENEGIFPRQDSFKGVGQRLQSGAQNLIKGVQHFVVGVLGAINNVNLQNEVGDAFQATDETTTSEYYDEDTTISTTPPSSTTTNTPLKLTTTIGAESSSSSVKSTTASRYKIRKPIQKVPTSTEKTVVLNHSVPIKVQVIPQYHLVPVQGYPQYQGQYLPPYQQPVVPGYAPQYQPFFPIQVPPYQQIPANNQQLLGGFPTNSINNNIVQNNPNNNLQTPQIVAAPPIVPNHESIPQNEPQLKSNTSQIIQPHISEIVTVTALPPQTSSELPKTSEDVFQQVDPVTLPALLLEEPVQTSSVPTNKPPNRLAQFSLNRKPSISNLKVKPVVQVVNKIASVPFGTVVRPNEPKYPIKSSNFVRTLKPLTHLVSVQKPFIPDAPLRPLPPPEEFFAVVRTTEEDVTTTEEVTEEPENREVVDPDNETVSDDTRKQTKN